MKLGDAVPDFSLPTTGGEFVLSDAVRARRTVVLYFYPKDDTPGCTLESGEFSALHDEFEKLDAVVLGVSRDDIPSHERFRGKFDYRHHLLADCGADLCGRFGVLREQAEGGRPAGGLSAAHSCWTAMENWRASGAMWRRKATPPRRWTPSARCPADF